MQIAGKQERNGVRLHCGMRYPLALDKIFPLILATSPVSNSLNILKWIRATNSSSIIVIILWHRNLLIIILNSNQFFVF